MRWYQLSLVLLVGGLLGSVKEAVAQTVPAATVPLPEVCFPALSDILRDSSRQSSRMILREVENAIAEGNRVQARSPELPNVSGWYSYVPADWQYRANTSPATQWVQRMSYNVGVSQPIYHWGALRDASRIGALGVKIAHGQTADAYRALVIEIRAQYLQLIVKKRGLVRTRFAQQLAQRRLELTRAQVENHVQAPSELFGVSMAVEQAALSVDRAVEDFANARLAFSKLTGGPAPSEEQLPDAIPVVTPAPEALQKIYAGFASQKSPSTFALEVLREQIEIEKLNYSVASKRLRPNLNAQMSLSQDQNSYSQDPGARYQVRDMQANLQVNWTIFDGFATRAAKANSLARRRQLEQTYQDQVEDTLDTVRSLYRQIEFAGRSLAMAEKMYGLAVNACEVQKDNLARGLASQADLENAKLSLYDAEISIYGSRADYMMRVCDFLSNTLADPALDNLPPDLRR